MPSSILKSKETFIWVILAGVTLLSWTLGNKYSLIDAGHIRYMTMLVMLLAFFKVRLVVMYFMEVDHAPLPLRILFELWCAGFGIALVVFYFFVPL